MNDIDDYMMMLRESQLKRTIVIEDVDKIVSENKKLKDLLKWCAKIMREPAVYIGTLEEKEKYINNLHKKQQLLYEIDEVLK